MIQDQQSTLIEAPPEVVWKTISDFENSYVFEHEDVEILSDDKTLRDGLRFTEKERIGGILASVEAEVFDVVPNSRYSFRGHADYHFSGLKIPIEQGGGFPEIPKGADPFTVKIESNGFGATSARTGETLREDQ